MAEKSLYTSSTKVCGLSCNVIQEVPETPKLAHWSPWKFQWLEDSMSFLGQFRLILRGKLAKRFRECMIWYTSNKKWAEQWQIWPISGCRYHEAMRGLSTVTYLGTTYLLVGLVMSKWAVDDHFPYEMTSEWATRWGFSANMVRF